MKAMLLSIVAVIVFRILISFTAATIGDYERMRMKLFNKAPKRVYVVTFMYCVSWIAAVVCAIRFILTL